MKLREAVVKHLVETSEDSGQSKRQRLLDAQEAIAKASLVRDAERRNANNERRSRGFGFIAFKEHRTAMKVLEFLNDNPKVFGGGKRPIVEFAIEDKRKLRMQQELFQKNAAKLMNAQQADGGKSSAAGAKGGKVDAAKDSSQNKIPDRLSRKLERRREAKRKEGVIRESRGRKQREKRRAQKAAEEERAKAKASAQAKREDMQARRAEDRSIELQNSRKRKKRVEPDAGITAKKRKRPMRTWEMTDDFELRALQRFREGGKA